MEKERDGCMVGVHTQKKGIGADVVGMEVSVFCKSDYSRKTMVASKRHENLYWFRPEPYV